MSNSAHWREHGQMNNILIDQIQMQNTNTNKKVIILHTCIVELVILVEQTLIQNTNTSTKSILHRCTVESVKTHKST